MHRLAPLALLLLAPALPGCLYLLGSAQPSCPGDMSGSSTISWDGADRTATLDPVWLDADPTGSCLTAATGTIEFGQDCSLSFQAEGGGDTLAIFDVNTYGEDGCGLGDTGWSAADLGASAIAVDGSLTNIGGDESSCFDGTLTVTLDLLLENDGAFAEVAGTLTLEGVNIAWFEERPCE